jgi:hypothetical protein
VLHQKWSEDDLLTTGLSASSANIQLHGELSDDELREWAEFKKELSKMFKNITQLEPELVAQYIIQLMPQLPDLIRKSSLNDGHKAQSELAGLLNMFYLMAEALQPEVLKNNVKFFMQVLATLTEHHVDQLTQRTVATQYFEIASRCSRLLASQPASPEHQQLIGAILAAFLSPQSGIRSPLASTRARHCYLFKNFVTNLLSHLGSFTAMIINNLKDLFQFDQTTLDYRLEDKLDLFEAVSKLVGSSQDVALQQQSLLVSVLVSVHIHICSSDSHHLWQYLVSPAIQRIEEIVAQQIYKQDPPNNPRHLILLANLIQSIGTFSKGMSIPIREFVRSLHSHRFPLKADPTANRGTVAERDSSGDQDLRTTAHPRRDIQAGDILLSPHGRVSRCTLVALSQSVRAAAPHAPAECAAVR